MDLNPRPEWACPLPVVQRRYNDDEIGERADLYIAPCGEAVRRYGTTFSSDPFEDLDDGVPEWELKCDGGHVLLILSGECAANEDYPKLTRELVEAARDFLDVLRPEREGEPEPNPEAYLRTFGSLPPSRTELDEILGPDA